MQRLQTLAAALIVATLLTGCERAERTAPAPAAAMPVAETPMQPRLPVSLNAVMVTLVNHAADPIWQAAWRNPESDRDWRNLEHMAYQLEIAGALLVIPGTGPMDDAWAADPAWKAWAGKLEEAGNRAVDAVKARDVSVVALSGDEIVDICEGCHLQFKPDMPTGGLFGELSPTEADFEIVAPPASEGGDQ